MSTKKCVCASDLDTYIVVEANVGGPDGLGGIATQWSAVHEAWAMVEIKKGSERFVAAHLQSEVYHVFTIRAVPGVRIDASHRISYRDLHGDQVVLNIRSVSDVDNRHEWLEIHAETGTGT